MSALSSSRAVVLEAPPGAGKTTRVPRALLDAGFSGPLDITVLEPRRLAARLAARRVAEELGEAVGNRVGYQLRLEDVSSKATKIRFVTEGILTRRLTRDRTLQGTGVVILDEFHERHLQGDLALALLQRLRTTERPDLAVIVMSATLAPEPVARFLGDAPILRSEGKRFDVTIEHVEQRDERPLEKQVASALRSLAQEGLDGDVLIFLPGALEIRRAIEACASVAEAAGIVLLPLHGSLSTEEQDRAVRRVDGGKRKKAIFATNIAETSVTIDGIVAVIDSGLSRVASHSPWSGLPSLKLSKISRASAAQRAGRAGRTAPGRCLRLYTRGDFLARAEHDAPEVARADLCEASLDLAVAGVADRRSFAWFEAPPSPSLAAADMLLSRLGAIDAKGSVTSVGRTMQSVPIHPRLARVVAEAEARGCGREGATLAALLSERDLGGQRRRRDARHASDALALLADFQEAERSRFAPHTLRAMGLDPMRVDGVRKTRDLLARFTKTSGRDAHLEDVERDLSIALLAGFPDRVGRLRKPDNATQRGREIVFAGGGSAELGDESGVDDVDLVVAIDVEERTTGRSNKTTVRVASAVEADWLLELFTDWITDKTVTQWNDASERVESFRRLAYDGLVLEETRGGGDPAAISLALLEKARACGIRAFAGGDALDHFTSRVAFARRACPEVGLPEIDAAALDGVLERACEGCSSFAELRDRGLLGAVRALLSPQQARELDALAPETIALAGGRKLPIEYPPNEAPRAESRLQDFFGMRAGPMTAKGRVPVVLSLLAPNHRAVQVTTDLAGFWTNHYPAIARELRRRYPRHAWPDDPLSIVGDPKRARR